MSTVVSAEVHHAGVRAIEARVEGDRVTVDRAASADHPVLHEVCDGRGGEAFRRFLDEHGFSRAPVVLSIPSGPGFLQHLQLPFDDEQKVRETAPFELEEYMQSVPIEDTQVDLQLLSPSDDGTRLLAGALEEETLDGMIGSLSSAGRPIVSIRFSLLSCYRYLLATGAAAPYRDYWVVSSDGSSVSVMLVLDGLPVATRDFYLAADREAARAGEAADEPDEHAEAGEAPGTDSPSSTSDASAWFDKLTQELERTLVSCGVHAPVDRLFFMGSPPEHVRYEDLPDHMDGLVLPDPSSRAPDSSDEDRSSSGDGTDAGDGDDRARSGDAHADDTFLTGDRVDIQWEVAEPVSRFSACVGGATTIGSSGFDGLDFRTGEFAEASLWESIRPDLVVFLVACLLGALTYLFVLQRDVSHREAVLQAYEQEQVSLYEELYPDQSAPSAGSIPQSLQKKLDQQQDDNPGTFPLNTSALQYWTTLYASLEGQGDIRITKLLVRLENQGDGGELILEGDAESRDLAVKLKNQVMSSKPFGRPDHARYPIRDNRVQFSMSFPIATNAP